MGLNDNGTFVYNFELVIMDRLERRVVNYILCNMLKITFIGNIYRSILELRK
jgi:hypothetical protein